MTLADLLAQLAQQGITACRPPAAVSLDMEGETLPEWIHLAPYGQWHGHGNGPFQIDAIVAAQMIRNFEGRKVDLVLDYEHQTLACEWNGQPAPASGWVDRLEIRENGVWGHVREWTARASELLRAREYRYLSPVIFWHHRDERTGIDVGAWLHSAALTNVPFLDDLVPVVAKVGSTPGVPVKTMLSFVLALLSLPETATQEEAEVGLTSLKTRAELGDVAITSLKLDPKNLPTDAATRLEGELKHSGYVTFEQHATALRSAGQQVQDLSDEQLLEQGRREGKITPAMESWAKAAVKTDRAGFVTWLKAAPKTVPVTSPVTNPPPAPGALSDTEAAVCRQLGLKPEAMKEK